MKCILKDSINPLCLKEEIVQKTIGFTYADHLNYHTVSLSSYVEKKISQLKDTEFQTSKQKWFKSYFLKEFKSCFFPDLCIKWVNDKVGYGVFTEKALPLHTYVGEYVGLIKKKPFFLNQANPYLFEYYLGEYLRAKLVIDAKSMGNHTRFINHSDQPNLDVISIIEGKELHIIFYTKQKIEKGKQLTYDYGETYWKDIAKHKSSL
ncbi:MAG: SET domain-containing protein-lysine N-methyltransferase [Rhabdochlamydiaceae bacterium]